MKKLLFALLAILIGCTSVCAQTAYLGDAPTANIEVTDKIPFLDQSVSARAVRQDTLQHAYDKGKATWTQNKSFSLPPTMSAAYDFLLWRTPVAITITNVSGVCIGGSASNYVVGGLDYTDSNGTSNTTAVDSDITFNGGLDTDDGALSNPTVSAGKWVRWHTTSVVGAPSGWTTITIYFREN